MCHDKKPRPFQGRLPRRQFGRCRSMQMLDGQSSCRDVNRVILRKLLQSCFFSHSPGARGDTGEAAEPGTETAQALESYREANFGYWQLSAFQKEFRPLDPADREIFVRRHSKDCLEPAQKVERRKTSGGGDFGKSKRRPKTGMNEVAPPIQPAPQLFTRRGASCGYSVTLTK